MGDTAATGIGWAFWVNWVFYIPSEALATGVFMNYFVKLPFSAATSALIWGIVALAVLTLVNIFQVKWFGHIESILAIIKIAAVVMFIVCAVLIWLGFIGSDLHPVSFKRYDAAGRVEQIDVRLLVIENELHGFSLYGSRR